MLYSKLLFVYLSAFAGFSTSCTNTQNNLHAAQVVFQENNKTMNTTNNIDTITFGAGCFWCVEAIFQNVNGVLTVESGYMGGPIKNPSYREVCTGRTGHAEVCKLTYNPNLVSFQDLLEVFFTTHDPTTLNRQGNDVGTQYRSAIFYYNDQQKEISEFFIKKLNEEQVYNSPIVTEVTAADAFYKAEDYHQNYFNLNGDQPYCQFVIQPKLEKFKKVFGEKYSK